MKSSAEYRNEGALKELGGKIRKAFGRFLGSTHMEAEGIVDEEAGRFEKDAGKAVQRARGKAEHAAGTVARKAGGAINDHELQVKGAAAQVLGTARQNINR